MIAWIVEGLIASAVLMVAVLMLRGPVRRAFGPDVAYALWLLPALRLLLPPIPQSWREIAVAPVARASETITYYVIEPLSGSVAGDAAVPVTQYPSLGPILLTAWVLGAAVFLAWHALAHARFCRQMIDQTARSTEIDGGVQLIETDAAAGPLAFGILRKYVAFPRDFAERYEREERDLALAHELGHHARGDLIANWVALAVLALHWFNPIAWRAFRAFRADQEIANDARVLAGLPTVTRHTYACAIIKAAHPTFLGGTVSATCHLNTINELKGRLRMLTTNKTSRLRLISGVAAVALLTLTGLGATASGMAAAETIRDKISDTTGVDFASIEITPPPVPIAVAVAPVAPAGPQTASLPAPPAPPAPPEWHGEGTRDVSTVVTDGPDGKKIKRVRVIMRDKDGKVTTENFQGTPDMADMPDVREGNCPEGANRKETVLHTKEGNKQVMIICTKRIEKMASEAADKAIDSEEIQRHALHSAMSGLRTARSNIAGNKSMTAEQREEALKGIDEAIREVESDIAKAN